MSGSACSLEEAKIWIANGTTSRVSEENCRAEKFAIGMQLVISLPTLLLLTTDYELAVELLDFPAALCSTA